MSAIAIQMDAYVIETLMRDLVSHSRSASAYLVYLQLYCLTHGAGKNSTAISHSVLAELIGISKRSTQTAIGHLVERKLLKVQKARVTAVPVYQVMTPWVRRGAKFPGEDRR